MKILRHFQVPTGDILIVEGEKGKLEMLSLGDYGKEVNLKCDAMGLSREINRVTHTDMLPLTKKWVVTISTQYGCSMRCKFCDVPKVGPGKNATFQDLIRQVLTGLKLHPEIEGTKRLNIHFARMGEPTWNPNVLDATKWLKTHVDPEFNVHPVVSTMMPRKNEWLKTFIHTWMRIKNRLYQGNAGLQLSINSTSEYQRTMMFSGNACTLREISEIMRGVIPNGRKITLNFAIAEYEIEPRLLVDLFSPDDYIIKLTPMHKTDACVNECIHTPGDYTEFDSYRDYESAFLDYGYEVLVFIASEYEDLGRITCGNAILSGTLPEVPYTEVSMEAAELRLAAERAEIERLEAERRAEEEKLRTERDRLRREREEEDARIRKEQEEMEAQRREVEESKRRWEEEQRQKAELEQAKKEAAERAKREAEERAKRDREEKERAEIKAKEEAAHQEALRPDKEKIIAFAENVVAAIPVPELTDPVAKHLFDDTYGQLMDLMRGLVDAARKL